MAAQAAEELKTVTYATPPNPMAMEEHRKEKKKCLFIFPGKFGSQPLQCNRKKTIDLGGGGGYAQRTNGKSCQTNTKLGIVLLAVSVTLPPRCLFLPLPTFYYPPPPCHPLMSPHPPSPSSCVTQSHFSSLPLPAPAQLSLAPLPQFPCTSIVI